MIVGLTTHFHMTNKKPPCATTDVNRIFLTAPEYLKRVQLFRIFLHSTGIAITLYLFYRFGFEYVSIVGTVVSLGVLLLADSFIRKNVFAVSIKDDTLIHQRLDQKSYLTSVRNISHIKHRKIFGYELIKYAYHLDGMTRQIYFFTCLKPKQRCVYDYLVGLREQLRSQKITLHTEKKEKANHKPGSVITV